MKPSYYKMPYSYKETVSGDAGKLSFRNGKSQLGLTVQVIRVFRHIWIFRGWISWIEPQAVHRPSRLKISNENVSWDVAHRPDDGGSKHLWNVGQFAQDWLHGATFEKRVMFIYSPPWESETSLRFRNSFEKLWKYFYYYYYYDYTY
jgi:hypothetical protein